MAGGPFAANIQCVECGGVADRIYEGVEDDRYACRKCGTEFGVCWDRATELPTKLFDESPPAPGDLARLAAQLRTMGATDADIAEAWQRLVAMNAPVTRQLTLDDLLRAVRSG
jgi:hypothetical protein